MPMDRFLIAPLSSGLQTNFKPWQILADSFEYLQNCYSFRGRIRKRFGSTPMGNNPLASRLAASLAAGGPGVGITDGSGNAIGALPNGSVGAILGDLGLAFGEGQIFSIGSEVYTIITDTPGVQAMGATLGSGTFNVSTGEFTITGAPDLTTIYFYPTLPVMGLEQYLTLNLNNHPSYAFDTRYAYVWNGVIWNRSGGAVWHGTNINYFWSTNWRGDPSLNESTVLFTSNFNASLGSAKPAATDDPIWYTDDGTNWTAASGSNAFFFRPGTFSGNKFTGTAIGTGPFVQTARIMLPYKTYFLLFNTVENDNSTPVTSLGSTDAGGNAAGVVPGAEGSIGEYFTIGNSTYQIVIANGAMLVTGTGAGTFNTATGAFTIVGGPALTPIVFYPLTGVGVATAYTARARWSFQGSPFAVNAWYLPNVTDAQGNSAAGAGFRDAYTEEQIVSAEFIKDHIIVYFERSTWELVYTGDDTDPFFWQKLNTELGSQSTFSTVPFDREVLTIGQTGVHACNGSNVLRIDEPIPEKIFDFQTSNNSYLRTYGIRDYYNEMVYWSYVDSDATISQVFPNQVLVFNYENKSWSMFDDCITAFGTCEQLAATTWADLDTFTWSQWNTPWNDSAIQPNQRAIIFGSPQGFVSILDDDIERNAPTMYIATINIASTGILTLTIISHNLNSNPTQLAYDDDFILIENVVGDLSVQTFLNGSIFKVNTVIDEDTITIDTNGGLTSGNYSGGGTMARVSNVQLYTKQFNPYVKQNRSVYVAKADFAVQKTAGGQITVDYYTSTAPLPMLGQAEDCGALIGSGILETTPYDPIYYPLEQYQTLLWHPVYFQSSGEFIQLFMYFNLAQMTTPAISLAAFELEGIALHTQSTSERMQ